MAKAWRMAAWRIISENVAQGEAYQRGVWRAWRKLAAWRHRRGGEIWAATSRCTTPRNQNGEKRAGENGGRRRLARPPSRRRHAALEN